MNHTETDSAIILAAGLSSRMGRDKAQLPWLGERCLAPWMTSALEEAGWQVRVVLGPHNWSWGEGALAVVRKVLNPRPEEGKSRSLQLGLEDCPDRGSVLITAVDQPRPAGLYRSLRAAANEFPDFIHLPAAGERRGHPLVIGAGCRDLLADVESRPRGMRSVLDAYPERVRKLVVPENCPHCDFNNPLDYQQALAAFIKFTSEP